MNIEKFIQSITKEAGRKLLRYFKKGNRLLSVRGTSKEVVTRYDKMIDKFLIQKIQKEFPDHSILTEESGWIRRKKEFLWIVDSLDGSSNFANQNPLFSVCVCLCLKNEPFLSTIYAPAIDEFYFAKKFNGAYLNGKRIKVSKIKKLKDSYIVYCEGNEKNKKRIAKIFYEIYPKVLDLRKIGSAGIESAWVAKGAVDGYFTTKIDPWDVASGILLVQEAGGKVSDFKGNTWQLKRSNLIFSNSLIHKTLQNTFPNFDENCSR
ncbi:MAG: inositol monophosphatase [Candidatus Pacebacteria bacterium]|nr:inositol monophosphatase [Candidatus Paceibacterota bacterium]